jgi:hypothetical protein
MPIAFSFAQSPETFEVCDSTKNLLFVQEQSDVVRTLQLGGNYEVLIFEGKTLIKDVDPSDKSSDR